MATHQSTASTDLPGSRTIFKVKSVDLNGKEGPSCFLSVNAGHLSYLRKGRHPSTSVGWPLNTIRKFGTSNDGKWFMFEAGRRAPNGEGVYAFKTDEASIIKAAFEHCSTSTTPERITNNYF